MIEMIRLTARAEFTTEDVLAGRLLAVALECWLLAARALDISVSDRRIER